eukprot:snap_masked-scaffold_74-processed-gene-0.47-mRNA-1 protein AED:1.00 eAED:1.00 QI:0/-1/0/0/-1/1/1/0/219
MIFGSTVRYLCGTVRTYEISVKDTATSALMLQGNIHRIVGVFPYENRRPISGNNGEVGAIYARIVTTRTEEHRREYTILTIEKTPYYLTILDVDQDNSCVTFSETRANDCDNEIFNIKVIKRPKEEESVLIVTSKIKAVGVRTASQECGAFGVAIFLMVVTIQDGKEDFEDLFFLTVIGIPLLIFCVSFGGGIYINSIWKYRLSSMKIILEGNQREFLV